MKKTKRSVWILAIGIVLLASVVALFCTANIRGYSRAQSLYDNGKYSEAYKIYSELGDYRDSAELAGNAKIRATYSEAEELFKNEDYEKAIEMYGQIPEYEDAEEKKELSEHLLKVKNDTTAPKISGIKPNEKIRITCGTEFNLKEYLDDNIKITDDVSGEIKEYDIRVIKDVVDVVTGKSVYNSASGEITTIVDSVLEFEISAKDSAENEAVVKISIELLPVHLSMENPKPVIYDGEYGLIQIQNFQHGYIYGLNQYLITFYVENKTSDPMVVHLAAETFINDYQTGAKGYLPDIISAGKRGVIENSITDDDIPDDLRDFPQIETLVCLRRDDMDEHSYYRVPLLIDIDAANMN